MLGILSKTNLKLKFYFKKNKIYRMSSTDNKKNIESHTVESHTGAESIIPNNYTPAGVVLFGIINKLAKKNIPIPKTLLKQYGDIKKDPRTNLTLLNHCNNFVSNGDKGFKRINKDLFDEINKEYYNIKKTNKYINPNFDMKEIRFHKPDEKGKMSEVGKDMIKVFKYFLSIKNGAPCFTWHQQLNDFSWLYKPDLYEQFKIYKKNIKNGKLEVSSDNNLTRTLDKTEWHCIVIHQVGNDMIDVCSLKLFDMMISGFVYWFNSKANRDAMYEYLIK